MSSHCIIRHGTAFFAYVQIAFTDFKEDLDIPSFSIDTDEEVEICLSFWLSCVILLFIAWASGFNCFSTTQLYRTRWFHAILLPVIIEFSRCIGTYSSAKFELFNYFPTCSLYRFCSISSIAFSVSTLPPLSFTTFFLKSCMGSNIL